jgi:hypothetical protein
MWQMVEIYKKEGILMTRKEAEAKRITDRQKLSKSEQFELIFLQLARFRLGEDTPLHDTRLPKNYNINELMEKL